MDTDSRPSADALLRAAAARIGRLDAEWLLRYALSRDSAWLIAHGRAPIEPGAAARFEALVERRASGEPVAYITGRRGFWSLELEVDSSVLIPRPETELLVELALARIPERGVVRIADLGTGSGAIALALAHERREAQVVAVDASEAALGMAARNVQRLGLLNVDCRLGDWCSALADERLDLIVSNPPYIADGDPHLMQGDLRFEPALALSSGGDGLDAIRKIVATGLAHLNPRGWLLLEHGFDQGRAVRELLESAGFQQVATHRDLEGRDRVSLGQNT